MEESNLIDFRKHSLGLRGRRETLLLASIADRKEEALRGRALILDKIWRIHMGERHSLLLQVYWGKYRSIFLGDLCGLA